MHNVYDCNSSTAICCCHSSFHNIVYFIDHRLDLFLFCSVDCETYNLTYAPVSDRVNSKVLIGDSVKLVLLKLQLC